MTFTECHCVKSKKGKNIMEQIERTKKEFINIEKQIKNGENTLRLNHRNLGFIFGIVSLSLFLTAIASNVIFGLVSSAIMGSYFNSTTDIIKTHPDAWSDAANSLFMIKTFDGANRLGLADILRIILIIILCLPFSCIYYAELFTSLALAVIGLILSIKALIHKRGNKILSILGVVFCSVALLLSVIVLLIRAYAFIITFLLVIVEFI